MGKEMLDSVGELFLRFGLTFAFGLETILGRNSGRRAGVALGLLALWAVMRFLMQDSAAALYAAIVFLIGALSWLFARQRAGEDLLGRKRMES